jgi:hypothetical protein
MKVTKGNDMQSESMNNSKIGISSEKPTRARFVILAILAVGTMINYLDRTVLGIAAPSLTKDLGLTATVMGLVFSAFSWTYAASQIPGGVFLDRFGNKVTYFLALTFWSLFTALQGIATGLYTLLFYRFGLGVALFSDQQPHRRYLVSTAGAGEGDQHLYGRRIYRSCRLRPWSLLDHGQLWLAFPVFRGRFGRHPLCRRLLVGL